ncbi:unnamed protein product [Oikopleura dioica]|uniref:Uncharacterized protein n=1 Tax=Oikopleura dioica TaxID=34765 RepID=E4XRZ0_OIKDI|nr:unnamed protein product [Oikopleura dioica]
MIILVLELEKDRFLVQRTNKEAEEIFEDYVSGRTDCIFTQRYKPQSFIIEKTRSGSLDDLEEVIFSYMLDFGIDNVRGGQYDELFFTKERHLQLKKKIGNRFDKCFNCLGNHRIRKCAKTIEIDEELNEMVQEILEGDSSGDEKIDPKDLDEDERLALRMQMGLDDGYERDESGNCFIICVLVAFFVLGFYMFIYLVLTRYGGKNLKVSFKTGR